MSNTNNIELPCDSVDIKADGNRNWLDLGAITFVKVAILSALLCYLFRDVIVSLMYRWNNDGTWSHGVLIPFFSLYFLHQRKKEIMELEPKSNFLGLGLLIFCIVFYALNVVYINVGTFNPMMIVFSIGAITLFLGGWGLIKHTWLPICYLFFAIPLPDNLYIRITLPMRVFASKISTVIMNLYPNLEAEAKGVVIDVVFNGEPLVPALNVAEACSGMRLLMTFVALGVAMAYLHERPIWQRLVLLCCTIPIAIICNVIRVTITGFIYILWDPKYAQGIYHDGLGLLMLPIAFGLYGGIAWLMNNILVDEEDDDDEDVIIRKSSRTEQ